MRPPSSGYAGISFRAKRAKLIQTKLRSRFSLETSGEDHSAAEGIQAKNNAAGNECDEEICERAGECNCEVAATVALLLGRVVGQDDAADGHEHQNPNGKLTVDRDQSVRNFVDDHGEENEGHQREAAAIDGIAQRLRVGHPHVREQKEERQMQAHVGIADAAHGN